MTTTKLSFSTVHLRYQAQKLLLDDSRVLLQRSIENHNFSIVTDAEPPNKERHPKSLPHSHEVDSESH